MGYREIAERILKKLLHSEIMSFGEPSLLVLLLQEEQDTGLSFGKETTSLLFFSKRSHKNQPSEVYTCYHKLSNSANQPHKKHNNVIAFSLSK